MTKLCKKCGEEKLLTTEFWKPSKSEKSGWYGSMCRSCFNAYYREQQKLKPEQFRAKEERYNKAHPEQYKAKRQRQYQSAKARGLTVYGYYGVERERERDRRRWAENPARRAYDRARWERRREDYNQRQRERYIEDPTQWLRKYAQRKEFLASAQGSHTAQQALDRFLLHRSRCYYCHKPLTKPGMDHRIPLSRGGTDFAANLVPACRSCNSRKGTKTELEYRAYLLRG